MYGHREDDRGRLEEGALTATWGIFQELFRCVCVFFCSLLAIFNHFFILFHFLLYFLGFYYHIYA